MEYLFFIIYLIIVTVHLEQSAWSKVISRKAKGITDQCFTDELIGLDLVSRSKTCFTV